MHLEDVLRHQGRRVAAIGVIAILYAWARPVTVSAATRSGLASRFHFRPTAIELDHADRTVRDVHPSLQRISAWISSVGAAVALADLDGNGLPDDLCVVNPRTEGVQVTGVPGHAGAVRTRTLRAPPAADDATTAPMGCVPADLDEDGAEDLLVYYWGAPPCSS